MRFQVLTDTSIKVTVVLHVVLVIDVSEVVAASIIRVIVLVIKEVNMSETLLSSYETTWQKTVIFNNEHIYEA
jgi:hypothetical protein